MAQSIRLSITGESSDLVGKALALFGREVEARTGITPRVGEPADGEAQVRVAVVPGLAPESYRITSTGAGTVEVVGGDPRGLLYGLGKLLRSSRFGDGTIELGDWRGTSAPAKPIRGMYFATHFGNFYEAAPVAEIERYVEELALWGCNALSVWFDMHQYAGIEDPAAQRMIDRLRRILQAAGAVGIRGGLTMLANEGYANSPEALRADWTAGHDGYTSPPGGHYHREICPSKPGGLDVILETRREMLEAFADLDIAYAWIWPYDQGGCTCSRCAPWGANGFLRTAEPVAGLVREVIPEAQVVLSTWYFDHFTTGEWEGLSRAFADGAPPWVDLLLAGDYGGEFPPYLRQHGVPGSLPVVSFPEISMEGNFPWGGYGVNPRPSTWEAYERRHGALLAGGFPYSEGIFEDLNKVLTLQLGWDPDRACRRHRQRVRRLRLLSRGRRRRGRRRAADGGRARSPASTTTCASRSRPTMCARPTTSWRSHSIAGWTGPTRSSSRPWWRRSSEPFPLASGRRGAGACYGSGRPSMPRCSAAAAGRPSCWSAVSTNSPSTTTPRTAFSPSPLLPGRRSIASSNPAGTWSPHDRRPTCVLRISPVTHP